MNFRYSIQWCNTVHYIGTVTHLRPVYEFTHLPAAHRRDIIGDQSAVLNSKQGGHRGRVSASLLRAVQTQIIGVKTAETAEC